MRGKGLHELRLTKAVSCNLCDEQVKDLPILLNKSSPNAAAVLPLRDSMRLNLQKKLQLTDSLLSIQA
jgi:hypothetical protein